MLQRVVNGILKVGSIAVDRPLGPATEGERALLAQLRAEMRALPTMPTEGVSASEANWNRNLNELRDLVERGDPREFLRWPMVLRAMFVTYPPYILDEFFYLRAQPDWALRWRDAVRESPVGHPMRLGFYPATSGNLTHHAYHLARFEALTGRRIEDLDVVFEFGGGYGSMARLFQKLGFRGRYVVFDLAHFSVLQRFYLKTLGAPVREPSELLEGASGIANVSDFDTLRSLLAGAGSRSLFLATWSISETPEHFRSQVLSLVERFAWIFIAYQHRFEEVDNVAWFRRWTEGLGDHDWRDEEMPQLPKNSYLVGSLR